jgi:hypothetical protein
MSISGISASTNIYQAYQTSGQNKSAQFRQDFQDLTSALQSSDLTGAQKAVTDLQQLMPNSSAGDQTQNAFPTDLNAVGQALQSGDQSDVQAAFAKLQQDVQSAQGHHHHHHQHNVAASTQSTTGLQADNGQGGSSQNPFSTDLNAVGQALQAGNLSDAQAAFAQLQQDMLSVQGHHHYRHTNASADAQSITPATSSSSGGTDNAGSSVNITA